MTKEISALFDGELEEHEAPLAWKAIKADSGLPRKWRDYQLIGDALRGERDLAGDICKQVMRGLEDEPVVFAPRPRKPAAWPRALMAAAASLAGVAVVGWLALAQRPSPEEPAVLAQSKPAAAAVARPTAAPPMQEYLLAHQASAPGLHLQGGTQHIRTVSVAGGGQ